MRRSLDLLYRTSGSAAALFILAICLLIMAQVVLNLIDKISSKFLGEAIGLTIPSYADFTGFFLAAASFLALAHTLREGGHIRVSLVIQNLPPRLRHWVEIWCVTMACAVTVFFTFYTASLTYDSFVYHDLSPGMVAVPIWIPQSTMLFGLFVLSIALIDEAVCLLMGHKASYEGKGENLLGDEEASHE
ncbi:MAG: TRAP transporter small permease [Rhodospirillales bacterium]|nr:TRAP transporter small permease [Rhodospirillales bacterium]